MWGGAERAHPVFSFFPGGSLPGILLVDGCAMETVYKATNSDLQAILVAAHGVD